MELLNVVSDMIEEINGNWLFMLGIGVFLSVYVLKKLDVFPAKVLAGVSVLLGVAIGVFVTWMTGNDVLLGSYNGFLAGLVASGGYDLIKLIAALFTGKINNWEKIEDILDDGELNDSNK